MAGLLVELVEDTVDASVQYSHLLQVGPLLNQMATSWGLLVFSLIACVGIHCI